MYSYGTGNKAIITTNNGISDFCCSTCQLYQLYGTGTWICMVQTAILRRTDDILIKCTIEKNYSVHNVLGTRTTCTVHTTVLEYL